MESSVAAPVQATAGRERAYVVAADVAGEAAPFDGGCGHGGAECLSSPSDWPHLPTDFRLQLQVLDYVVQQGQQLQRLAEQQQTARTQFATFKKDFGLQQERAQKQLSDQLESFKGEFRDLRRGLQQIMVTMEASTTKQAPLFQCQHPSSPNGSEQLPFNGITPTDASMLNAGGFGERGPQQGAPGLRGDSPSTVMGKKACDNQPAAQVRAKPRTDPGPRSPCQNCLMPFVTSSVFEGICATVIIANAITIGIAAHYSIVQAIDTSYQTPLAMQRFLNVVGYVFVTFYTSEAMLKIFVFRLRYFVGTEWKWNCFDFVLVLTAFSEIVADVLDFGYGGSNMTWMRLLRLMKMLKMLRVVRVMRFFRELRMMLSSIIGSFGTLLWSILMLSLLTYIFGLCFLNAVTGYLEDTPRQEISEETMSLINDYWSSVFQSTVTLYMAVTGGSDWEPLAKPIRQTGDFYYMLFLFYIAFSAVAVLNVLTGMFVDTAMKVADVDEGNVHEEVMEKEAPFIDNFRQFLNKKDIAGHNTVAWEDIRRNINHPAVKAFVKALELDNADMKRVYSMLKAKSDAYDNKVEIDEFIAACSKVKGDQKGIGMLSLMSDTRRYMAQMSLFMQYTEERMDEQHRLFEMLGAPNSTVKSLAERLVQNRCLPVQWECDAEMRRTLFRNGGERSMATSDFSGSFNGSQF